MKITEEQWQQAEIIQIQDKDGVVIVTKYLKDENDTSMAICIKTEPENEMDNQLVIMSASPIAMIDMANDLIEQACKAAHMSKRSVLKLMND